MKHAKFTSLGRKIAALVAAGILTASTLVAIMLVFLQLNESIQAKRSQLQASGYVYAAAIAGDLAAADRQRTLEILNSIARSPDIVFAVALDGRGQVIASTGNTVFLTKDIVSESSDNFSMLTKGVLPVAVDIIRGGERVGKLVLIADISSMRSDLLWVVLMTIAAATLASLIAVIISSPMRRRIVGPILSLTGAMQEVKSTRDYTTKVSHQSSDETGVLVDTFNSMIEEIRFRDASLERLAYIDPLTGLPNRQHFQKMLDELFSPSKQETTTACIMLLDLDGFKQVNDTFGHSSGDALLMNIAAILKGELGGRFSIARLAADEFGLIGMNISSESEALEHIAPFVAALYQPVRIIEQDLYISASIGGVLLPRDGDTPNQLVRRADLALNKAKSLGTGRVRFFQIEMDEEVQERAELVKGLRNAISENELEAYYQPQLNLRDGKVFGFESLLRWKHPVRGLIPPAKFIPIAEQVGLIGEIGKWILRDSCARGKAWLEAGNPPREISVNVSPAQILEANFFKDVRSALVETCLPPHLLCLEMTESLFVGKSIDRIQRTLNDLKSLGLLLALDDFGTGYSSLSHLAKLPFDIVKIDRAFVGGCDNDVTKYELLRGIVELAHALGMEVVAEGAETESELLLLGKLNVDYVQGYVLSAPLPATEALAAVKTIQDRVNRGGLAASA